MKDFLACLVALSMSVALVGCKKSDEPKVDATASDAAASDVAASDAADSITSASDAVAEKVSDAADKAADAAGEVTKQVSMVLKEQTVEAGCAGCTYKMEGVEGCQLAIKVAGKPYLVTGTDVSAHDAGLCEATKKATIVGTIEGTKVALTKFEFVK